MHLQLVNGLPSVERPHDESAFHDTLFIPAQGNHHPRIVPANPDILPARIDPQRPGSSAHAERPHNGSLRRGEEPGLLEVLLQPVRASLVIANHLRLVVQQKRAPFSANPHGRVNGSPMHLVNPPEPVGITVIVKGTAGLHPLVPGPYMALHRLQWQLEAHAAQVPANMLRHPVVHFIDLAHAQAPIRSGLEGEGEDAEGDATAQPLHLEGKASLRFPWEDENSEGIARAQPFDLEGEASPSFPCEKLAPYRNHVQGGENAEGHASAQPLALNEEGVEGEAPSRTP